MNVNTILTFYGYLIFFYSMGLILSYVVLLLMAYIMYIPMPMWFCFY